MKKSALSLLFAASTALPVAAFAIDNSDALNASFERGFDKGVSAITTTTATRDNDPLQQMITAALYSYSHDNTLQLLASFEQGFDKGASEATRTVASESSDPLWNIFAQANWGSEYVALMLAAQEANQPVKSAATETTVYSANPVSVN